MDAFSDAVGAIYDAALSPEAWPEALERIGALFGGRGAVIYFASGEGEAEFIFSPGLGDAVRVYQDEGWALRDTHAQRAIGRHLGGEDVFDDLSVMTPEEIGSLPIRTEFFRRVGFGWLMGCVILPDLDMLACVSVPRAEAAGPYDAAEREMLRLIGRHVEQALRISLRIANLEQVHDVLLEALDQVRTGICLLDGAGRFLTGNQVGRAQADTVFEQGAEGLVPRDAAARDRFRALVAAAIAGGGAAMPSSCLLREAGGEGLVATVLPVTESARSLLNLGQTPRALVLTTASDRGATVDPTVLRDLFDLSLGEARLAALIGGGVTVRRAAGQLGVAEGTARVVLKNIFRKLGINRQAELVLQVSALGRLNAHRPG